MVSRAGDLNVVRWLEQSNQFIIGAWNSGVAGTLRFKILYM